MLGASQVNGCGPARDGLVQAWTRTPGRSYGATCSRSLWHEERFPASESLRPSAHPTTLAPVHPGCGDR
jgi:hypothetical protein